MQLPSITTIPVCLYGLYFKPRDYDIGSQIHYKGYFRTICTSVTLSLVAVLVLTFCAKPPLEVSHYAFSVVIYYIYLGSRRSVTRVCKVYSFISFSFCLLVP
jgi:hypothetical protein